MNMAASEVLDPKAEVARLKSLYDSINLESSLPPFAQAPVSGKSYHVIIPKTVLESNGYRRGCADNLTCFKKNATAFDEIYNAAEYWLFPLIVQFVYGQDDQCDGKVLFRRVSKTRPTGIEKTFADSCALIKSGILNKELFLCSLESDLIGICKFHSITLGEFLPESYGTYWHKDAPKKLAQGRVVLPMIDEYGVQILTPMIKRI